LLSWSVRKRSTSARSTVNTVGTRLRSSSAKTRPGSATCSGISRLPVSPTVTSDRPATAFNTTGNSDSPRAFSASMRIALPRAVTTSGGSIIAVSQRV
jgi:hypothetical protein